MRNLLSRIRVGLLALLMLGGVNAIPVAATAQSRIFDLHLQNGTDTSMSIIISGIGHNCYEGSPGIGALLGPMRPGAVTTIRIARVQGHGCDGEQGVFSIQPTYGGGESQGFSFSNNGALFLTSTPTGYQGALSGKAADESYTWTISSNADRMSGPMDASFTEPRNRIANDAGVWNSTSQITRLSFRNRGDLGLWGNFYDDCVGYELFHPQHVVRLPNKNGLAYFMVAQSRAHNGWISVLRTYPGEIDPATDALRANPGQFVGEYIWQDLYKDSAVGNWNHPGKMDIIGGILVVAAQNWDESGPCDYGRGSSIDKVLFYDVRDPEAPKYWGAITSAELGVSEISTVGLVRARDGTYFLNAGGDGAYTTWTASAIGPNIGDWRRIDALMPSFSGQHGMNFSSYQKRTGAPGSVDPAGDERLMYFDSSGEAGTVAFTEFAFIASNKTLVPSGARISHSIVLPGANRDWDSDSLYVSEYGEPIVYSMESANGEHGVLYQIVPSD